MTRRTIAILRKLVRAEIKECRGVLRDQWSLNSERLWAKAHIAELNACLDDLKKHVDGQS